MWVAQVMMLYLFIGGQGISFVAVGPYTVKEAQPLTGFVPARSRHPAD